MFFRLYYIIYAVSYYKILRIKMRLFYSFKSLDIEEPGYCRGDKSKFYCHTANDI